MFEEGDSHVLIVPPKRSMFDQVYHWLNIQPQPPYVGLLHYIHGIGATALCLRWGTYLAVLMDHDKPIDIRTRDPSISMISNSEMMRINIEASTNLEWLLQYLHEDEFACYKLLEKAYVHLPMPHKRVKRDLQLAIVVAALAKMHNAQTDASPTDDSTRQLLAHPYRALANFITLWAYRNGEIENVHAGSHKGYSLAHRRFTSRQEQTIMRKAASKLSGVITGPHLWEPEYQDIGEWPNNVAALVVGYPFYYPSNWTLDRASPQIELHRQDKFP